VALETETGRQVAILVDDEPDLLESCARILEGEGYRCVTTTDGSQVAELVRTHNPSVVVTDFRMPGRNGMEVLQDIHSAFPEVPVIMVSAYATIDGVVQAVKLGAFDYLVKPFTADQLTITVRRATERFRLQRENETLKKKLKDDYFNHFFVGKHPKFLKCVEIIQKVADSESNVLIHGETGSGKELAARAIHIHSKRAGGPFIAINCSTLTQETLEASSVVNPAKGVLEAAGGGTLYLEQVEELDQALQARLLRILQEKRIPRRGEWDWTSTDIRLVASTSVDLHSMSLQKEFRENLYYCLNVINIVMPPLRDRKEDIGILCDLFLKRIAERKGLPKINLDPGALERLLEYYWPGNVRELMSVMETAVPFSDSKTITLRDLPEEIRNHNSLQGLTFKEAKKRWMDQFEKLYLENLLIDNNGNISKASEEAGIARMSLYRMLERTGLKEFAPNAKSAEQKQETRDRQRQKQDG
jgi:DNA-binding NtrC family response regulator